MQESTRPGVGMLWGIIFQQMGAGGGTALGFSSPAAPQPLLLSPSFWDRGFRFSFLGFPPCCRRG